MLLEDNIKYIIIFSSVNYKEASLQKKLNVPISRRLPRQKRRFFFFLISIISAYHLSYRQKVISIAALETFAE